MSPRLAGSGLRWRRWACAIGIPSLRTRRHAAPIGPNELPQPSASTRALPPLVGPERPPPPQRDPRGLPAARVVDDQVGDVDAVDLRLPQPDHLVVVVR